MKKIMVLALLYFSAHIIYAQQPILQSDGAGGFTPANIYQDPNTLIGVNTPSAITGVAGILTGTLDVTGGNDTSILTLHYDAQQLEEGIGIVGEVTNAHPDVITAFRTVNAIIGNNPNGTPHFEVVQDNLFNVNPIGQVGIGVANEQLGFYGSTDLLIMDKASPALRPIGFGPMIAAYDPASYAYQSNPIFVVANTTTGDMGSRVNSSAGVQIYGNSNQAAGTPAALAIWDNAENLNDAVLAASGTGAVGLGTSSPMAQVDIIDNTYVSGSSLDFLLHVGEPAGRADYFSVYNQGYVGIGQLNYGVADLEVSDVSSLGTQILADDGNYSDNPYFVVSNNNVGIGMWPSVSSTLAIQAANGHTIFSPPASTTLDLFEPNANPWSAQIRFFDNSGNLRHVITDDVGATNNLIIHPGWPGSTANSTLEIEGYEQVDNDFFAENDASVTNNLTVGGNANVSGIVVIGNVTSPPGYNLYVQNGVLAERYKCALASGSDWSDYVFDKDYKLMSLNEVAQYVQQNKHLPGIPGADETVKDGIDLGQMDAKLLAKVEELTLYVIKQQQEIDALKKCVKIK